MRSGIDGWISRDFILHLLPNAIRAVAGGAHWIDPSLAAQLMEEMESFFSRVEGMERRLARYESPLGRLNERQHEILLDLMEGLTNRQIAERRHLSEAAVKDNVSQILHRLNVPDRKEAAALARKFGLGS
jgi:DNA-binding NarL/FixJ family response regulator